MIITMLLLYCFGLIMYYSRLTVNLVYCINKWIQQVLTPTKKRIQQEYMHFFLFLINTNYKDNNSFFFDRR